VIQIALAGCCLAYVKKVRHPFPFDDDAYQVSMSPIKAFLDFVGTLPFPYAHPASDRAVDCPSKCESGERNRKPQLLFFGYYVELSLFIIFICLQMTGTVDWPW